MSNITSKETLFEHQFWLRVLGDHGRLIRGAFPSDERDKINKISYFINLFAELLALSEKPLSEEQIYELTKVAFAYTEELKLFVQQLDKEYASTSIQIDLPQVLVSQIATHIEAYLKTLQTLLESNLPVVNFSEKSEIRVDASYNHTL